jgi:hypothetical protein
MLLLTFAVLLPLYAVVASWAHRTGGMRRLWAAGVASAAVAAAAASVVAARSAPARPAAGVGYLAALYGVPILCATFAASLTRARVAAVLVGGAVGVVVVLAVSMFVLGQVQG